MVQFLWKNELVRLKSDWKVFHDCEGVAVDDKEYILAPAEDIWSREHEHRVWKTASIRRRLSWAAHKSELKAVKFETLSKQTF